MGIASPGFRARTDDDRERDSRAGAADGGGTKMEVEEGRNRGSFDKGRLLLPWTSIEDINKEKMNSLLQNTWATDNDILQLIARYYRPYLAFARLHTVRPSVRSFARPSELNCQ